MADRLTVVLLTHDCARWIERTARKLLELDVPVIAVDNASSDSTVACLRRLGIPVVALATNVGAAARNLGAERATTPYVAFCDDDGWYESPGLAHAIELFDRHTSLAVVNARILVGAEERLDPISHEMQHSPLTDEGEHIPGKVLVGFMAGAVVVRRAAFLEVGGYDRRFFMGGEEETVAVPLLRRGWRMRYVPSVVVHHYPSGANAPKLRHFGVRNTLVNAWLHRPVRSAISWTAFIVRTTPSRTALALGLLLFVRDTPWIARERAVISEELEQVLHLLEQRRRSLTPGRHRAPDAVW